jgi:hypothetical protein
MANNERALAAITHAMATLEAVRGDMCGEPLVKAATPTPEALSDAIVAEAHAVVAAIIGTDDPAAVAGAITAAMGAPLDVYGAHDAAVAMGKAVTSAPTMPATAKLGLGLAEVEMRSRLEPLEHLAKHTGTVRPATLVEARSNLAAVELAKTLKPIPPKPAAYVDRRAELRALRDQQRDVGNHDGAQLTQRELDLEEVKAATRTPSASVAWGDGVRPLPAA